MANLAPTLGANQKGLTKIRDAHNKGLLLGLGRSKARGKRVWDGPMNLIEVATTIAIAIVQQHAEPKSHALRSIGQG